MDKLNNQELIKLIKTYILTDEEENKQKNKPEKIIKINNVIDYSNEYIDNHYIYDYTHSYTHSYTNSYTHSYTYSYMYKYNNKINNIKIEDDKKNDIKIDYTNNKLIHIII